MVMVNVLYIHGMGGGGDSRIPSVLREFFASEAYSSYQVNIVVRTYDFDPEIAHEQIRTWVEELQPALLIGESLGAVHAIRIKGIPHLLISPALNAPYFLHFLSHLTWIPGVTWLFDRIYKPREGDRQRLHFSTTLLRKYKAHVEAALKNSTYAGSDDSFFAFIGTKDHYRKTGVVSVRSWKKYFGTSFILYEGSHYTEEEYIYAQVLPEILKELNIK